MLLKLSFWIETGKLKMML